MQNAQWLHHRYRLSCSLCGNTCELTFKQLKSRTILWSTSGVYRNESSVLPYKIFDQATQCLNSLDSQAICYLNTLRCQTALHAMLQRAALVIHYDVRQHYQAMPEYTTLALHHDVRQHYILCQNVQYWFHPLCI